MRPKGKFRASSNFSSTHGLRSAVTRASIRDWNGWAGKNIDSTASVVPFPHENFTYIHRVLTVSRRRNRTKRLISRVSITRDRSVERLSKSNTEVVGTGSERKTQLGWPCAQSHFRRITMFHPDVGLLARWPIHSLGKRLSFHSASPRSSLIGASNSTIFRSARVELIRRPRDSNRLVPSLSLSNCRLDLI